MIMKNKTKDNMIINKMSIIRLLILIKILILKLLHICKNQSDILKNWLKNQILTLGFTNKELIIKQKRFKNLSKRKITKFKSSINNYRGSKKYLLKLYQMEPPFLMSNKIIHLSYKFKTKIRQSKNCKEKSIVFVNKILIFVKTFK